MKKIIENPKFEQPQLTEHAYEGECADDAADRSGLWIPFEGNTLEVADGVIIGLVQVTPELAELWLARNLRNRKISQPSVNQYARNIEHDQWPFTGDPVRFSDNGDLLDGQHRLTAIHQTGRTLPLLVITGLHERTQAFMDGGRKRNAADTLAIRELPNYVAVSSLVRLALLWNPGGIWEPSRGTQLYGRYLQISTAEILDFAARHPEVHSAALRGVTAARLVPGARASVIGAAYLRARLLDDIFDVDAWFDSLETGANLTLGDPVLALRNGMMRTAREGFNNPQVQQLWKVIRTWNASRGEETMDRVIMTSRPLNNDNFPDMQ